jgi:hypothetical protein
MLLFISHASEDKADFVEPLVDALSKHYEVWFDKFRLTLGDSLLQKINEGLRECDFGVVVLSPAFFAKRWPQAELDGLFALEDTTRKLILPIWKDVTVEDVRQFSPILAGRLAVLSSVGIPKVVDEIRLAVENSERKRQLTILDSATQRCRMLDQSLKERRDSANLLGTERGVALLRAGFQSITGTIETALLALSQDSDVLKFECGRPTGDSMFVHGPFRITLGLRWRDLCENSASQALLIANLFTTKRPHYPEDEIQDLSESEFTPSFASSNEIRWTCVADKQQFGSEEFTAQLIDILVSQIERLTRP